MKLSNKILIGFFGFILIYLTAVFAEVRLSGSSNNLDDNNSIAETVDLTGITYLILENVGKDVHVIGSDRSELEIRSFTGGLLPKLKYTVSGDSLRLSRFEAEEAERVKISVFVSKNFKWIEANESVAIVEGLQQDMLYVSGNSGRVWMKDNRIARIHMDLSSESFLDISGPSIDTLSVEIEGSEAYISSPIGLLQGSLKNKASLQLNNIQGIQLKKDESSRLNVY